MAVASRLIETQAGARRRVVEGVRRVDQRLVFVVVGAFNTGVSFALFTAFQLLVGVRWGYMWSLVLTHVTSVLVAFVSHRRVTFHARGRLLGDLLRFESVYLFAVGANAALLPFFVEFMGLKVLAAQAVVTVVTAVLSWLGHSRITFRRERHE